MNNPFEGQAPVPGIKKIIAIGSGKGGVGKSSVSINLATSLQNKGFKVGLLDADVYGPSIPRMMGALHQKPPINEEGKIIPITKYGIKLMSMGFLVEENQAVIWRGPMLFKAIDQFFKDVAWGELDYLLIDLPPGTGDVCLTIAQKVPVDGAIVVCTPQNIALVDASKAVDMFKKINIPILGVVENMSSFKPPGSDISYDLFPKGQLDKYIDTHGLKKLTEVPFDPHVGVCAETGIPFLQGRPESPAAIAFQSLSDKVEQQTVQN